MWIQGSPDIGAKARFFGSPPRSGVLYSCWYALMVSHTAIRWQEIRASAAVQISESPRSSQELTLARSSEPKTLPAALIDKGRPAKRKASPPASLAAGINSRRCHGNCTPHDVAPPFFCRELRMRRMSFAHTAEPLQSHCHTKTIDYKRYCLLSMLKPSSAVWLLLRGEEMLLCGFKGSHHLHPTLTVSLDCLRDY